MTDRIIDMCRFLSLKTDEWNYSMVLWRSSQLYSCSFAYSTLSIITGTSNAFKALTRNAYETLLLPLPHCCQGLDDVVVISCERCSL